MATACDTANGTFDRLVDRGQQVQDEWQTRTDDFLDQNAGARTRVQGYFRGAVDAFLDSISVPNKSDVDTINVKLNILTRKLDDLQMQSLRETEPVPTAVPDDTVPPPVTGDLST